MLRHIVLLRDQNRELEDELEKFLISDQEIRNKLMDRERSPLRMADLYDGHNLKNLQHEFDSRSTPVLFNLQKCSGEKSQGKDTPPKIDF